MMPSATNFWIRWRVRVGYPVAAVFLILARPTGRSLLAGVLIAAVGLLIRAWAAGYLRKHESLATSGPYSFTRNPLYFGSVFLALGFIIAGNSIWAGILVVAYIVLFYPAVMRREEAELRIHYGSQFDDYTAAVPLFWPRLFPKKNSGVAPVQFSRELYLRNREYQALVGTVLGLLLLWAKMKWLG